MSFTSKKRKTVRAHVGGGVEIDAGPVETDFSPAERLPRAERHCSQAMEAMPGDIPTLLGDIETGMGHLEDKLTRILMVVSDGEGEELRTGEDKQLSILKRLQGVLRRLACVNNFAHAIEENLGA